MRRRLFPRALLVLALSMPSAAVAQVVTLPTFRDASVPEIEMLRRIVGTLRVDRFAPPDSCLTPSQTAAEQDQAFFQRALDKISLAGLTRDDLQRLRSRVDSGL